MKCAQDGINKFLLHSDMLRTGIRKGHHHAHAILSQDVLQVRQQLRRNGGEQIGIWDAIDKTLHGVVCDRVDR